MNPKIRPATHNDLESINTIYNLAIPSGFSTADTEPITMRERVKWFKKHIPDRYPVFVADVDQKVVGWICLSPYREGRKALRYTVEITYYIHPDYQQKGIGSALMDFMIKKAPEYQAKTLVAMLLEQNTGSISLLEKFGFQKWGLLPGAADFGGREDGHLYYGLRIRDQRSQI